MLLPPSLLLLLVISCGAGRVTNRDSVIGKVHDSYHDQMFVSQGLQGDITQQVVIAKPSGVTAICDLKIGIANSQITGASVKYS